jgi:hypothetical protein
MNAEDLDTAIKRLKAQAKPGRWRNDVISAIGSDVRAVLSEIDRLRKVIQDAPHGIRWDGLQCPADWLTAGYCECWKAETPEPTTCEEKS